jgi:hypothetical protein
MIAALVAIVNRWCRCAQPPATCCTLRGRGDCRHYSIRTYGKSFTALFFRVEDYVPLNPGCARRALSCGENSDSTKQRIEYQRKTRLRSVTLCKLPLANSIPMRSVSSFTFSKTTAHQPVVIESISRTRLLPRAQKNHMRENHYYCHSPRPFVSYR